MKNTRNVPLIVGLSIPVLMIIFISLSIYLPELLVKPKTNFLYCRGDSYSRQKYTVNGGRIMEEEVTYPEKYEEYANKRGARIFIHDVQENMSREISFAEAAQMTLNSSPQSPDGFEIVVGSSGYGFFPLSYHRSYYGKLYLKGHSRSQKLNIQRDTGASLYHYDGDFTFLGWILEEE